MLMCDKKQASKTALSWIWPGIAYSWSWFATNKSRSWILHVNNYRSICVSRVVSPVTACFGVIHQSWLHSLLCRSRLLSDFALARPPRHLPHPTPPPLRDFRSRGVRHAPKVLVSAGRRSVMPYEDCCHFSRLRCVRCVVGHYTAIPRPSITTVSAKQVVFRCPAG